jgi:hypothetical protein
MFIKLSNSFSTEEPVHYLNAVDLQLNVLQSFSYKPNGRVFDSRCRHWNFFIDVIIGSLHLLEASGPAQACNGIALPS